MHHVPHTTFVLVIPPGSLRDESICALVWKAERAIDLHENSFERCLNSAEWNVIVVKAKLQLER
jgi:hypothetical protein